MICRKSEIFNAPSGDCCSPMACHAFGYCRDRNHQGLPSDEAAREWRKLDGEPA